AQQGRLLRDGVTLVIAGKPNSGKSSLLNVLSNKEIAIVTTYPGTTRDILRESIHISGMPVHVVDTAGIRDSDDCIEQEGIRRARQEIEAADRILWMIDATDPEHIQLDSIPTNKPNMTKIYNKIDLLGKDPCIRLTEEQTEIFLSVKTGHGMDLLYEHIKDCIGYNEQIDNVFIARRRHLDALTKARCSIEQAAKHVLDIHTAELIAEDLRNAQHCLSLITGVFTTDDLLDKIFASFCIGK
ncbi:MAG: GTPase, partial [Methylococcales bacterium]